MGASVSGCSAPAIVSASPLPDYVRPLALKLRHRPDLAYRSAGRGLRVFAPVVGFSWSKFTPGMLINWQRPTGLTPLADYVFGSPLGPLEAVWVTALATVAFTGIAVAAFRRAEL